MIEVTKDMTLWQLVERRAALSPNLLMFEDEYGRKINFLEFRDRAVAVAASMAQHVSKGSVVAWQLPTSPEAFILMAGFARLGCIQSPLLPVWRDKELQFIVRELQCNLLVVPREWRSYDYASLADRVTREMDCKILICEGDWSSPTDLNLPIQEVASGPKHPASDLADEIRWVFYTSGTTGNPKGVRHTDRSVMASHLNLILGPQLSAGDVTIQAAPIAHVGGIMTLVAQLVAGFKTVLVQYFDSKSFPKLASQHGATVLRGPIPILRSCLNAQESEPKIRLFPKLRTAQAVGSARPRELHRSFRRVLGIPLTNTYGMTECPALTYSLWNDDDSHVERSDGRPVDGGKIKIVDQHGIACPNLTDGEICLFGTQLFRGYVDETINVSAFDSDGFFRTGDVGHLDDDGYLYVTGRLKDIIIRNGENISASELEEVVYAHSAVADVAMIGVPNELTGESCCAVIELVPGQKNFTLSDVIKQCEAAGIAKHKFPEDLIVVAALPRNSMGKVEKGRLKEMIKAGEVS